jgi:polyhydroxyalkanoate synthase
MDYWGRAARAAAGGKVEPIIEPERGDRRFKDPSWSDQPVFDYLKQAYLLASRQTRSLIENAEGVDEPTRTRAAFFAQAYLDALSPANFAFTNPEAIRRAIETGSLSLLSGLANLLADAATEARLPQRRTSSEFELGRDLAATPGSVVFQNELMQLIQYTPVTDTAWKRPLLYVPPLVNKYYLLDLQPRSSLIRWLVEQGHSLFVISWINPGPELAERGMADYLEAGPIAALGAIEQATGEREVDLFGFCMGGTLAAIAAAILADVVAGRLTRSASL